MGGEESSAFRSLGQLFFGEVFAREINLEAQKWAE